MKFFTTNTDVDLYGQCSAMSPLQVYYMYVKTDQIKLSKMQQLTPSQTTFQLHERLDGSDSTTSKP